MKCYALNIRSSFFNLEKKVTLYFSFLLSSFGSEKNKYAWAYCLYHLKHYFILGVLLQLL